MITLYESYDASSSFYSINNPDRIASEYIGPTIVGNVTINDYMRYEKGQDAKIEYMTAKDYMQGCSEIFGKNIDYLYKNLPEKSNVDKYAKGMLKGDKFPIPNLDYVNYGQEGRHRALAVAKAFGEDATFPVIVIRETEPTKEELRDYCNRKFPNKPYYADMFYDGLVLKYFPEEDENEAEYEGETEIETAELANNDFSDDDEIEIEKEIEAEYGNAGIDATLDYLRKYYK